MKFSCSACGQHLEADSNYAGLTIKCPACKQPLQVPIGKMVAAPVAAPVAVPSRARPWMPAVPAVQRTSALAIWSLAMSVASVILGPLGYLPGIVCGHMARGAIRRNPGLRGKGMATAGLVVGYSVLVLTVAFLALFMGTVLQAVRAAQAHH